MKFRKTVDMAFPLIPLISAIGGVAGSLIKPKQETTKTESTVNYQEMVDKATAAGFNPLTAIRNGGSAGFSTSTTTSPGTSALPGALSNLGGVLGDAMTNAFDPLAKKQRQLDTALVDYQLRQLKQGPAMPGRLYPGGQTYGVKTSSVAPLGRRQSSVAPTGAEDVFIPYKDRGGKTLYMMNPNMASWDQYVGAAIGKGLNYADEKIQQMKPYIDKVNRNADKNFGAIPAIYKSLFGGNVKKTSGPAAPVVMPGFKWPKR